MPGSETAFRGSSARRWKACRWTSRRWRKLVDSSDETQRAATDGEMGAREEGAAQASRYRRRVANRCRICLDHTLAIVDDEALHALIRAQFEGAGDGAELLRLFAHLASRPQLQLPEALRHRAAEIIESVWDERLPRRSAGRRAAGPG